ncbi:glycoside hydrolase domain-containing protein [Arthrobacter alpinus]|uniref:glycoside hydrolase domain-containing protein n=1 Tax=Arthrobacter alpinus TaxID=656366 RepID=UPI0009E6F16A
MVYPAPDGEFSESIRCKVFAEAMNDMRAMELLRTIACSEEVARIIDPDSSITLSHFSYEPDHYRSVINQLALRLMKSN